MSLGSSGRASFAVIAVVLLGLANVAAVYAAVQHQAQTAEEGRAAERQAALLLLDGGRLQVRLLADSAAERALRGSPLPNITALQARFRQALDGDLAAAFPLRSGTAMVELAANNATVFVDTLVLREPSPLPPLTARVGPGGRIARVPDPASPRPEVLLPSPWALRVSGSVDLRLQAPGWETLDRVALDHETHHALPFLAERIRTFRDAVRGDTSDFARVIRYMLTTLVQYRILEGYAWGEYGVSGTAVGDILTTADIEQAVNLGLLLEQVRVFRDFDDAQAAGLDASLGKAGLGITADLLTRHARGGAVDPADLFLLLKGFDGTRLPLHQLLAHALLSLQESAGLRLADYLGIGPLADLYLQVTEAVGNAFLDFLGWVVGVDREVEAVKAYFQHLLGSAGANSLVLGPVGIALPAQDYSVPNGGNNTTISVPAGTYGVALPTFDLFAKEGDAFWKAYYHSDFRGALTRVHDGIEGLAKDIADKIATDLQAMIGLDDPVLRIDPKDGVSLGENLLDFLEARFFPAVRALRDNAAAAPALFSSLARVEAGVLDNLTAVVNGSYWTFAHGPATNASAVDQTAGALLAAATSDPDFGSLDGIARATLASMILTRVRDSGWGTRAVEAARARDFAELAQAREAVANAQLSPQATGRLGELLDGLLGPGGFLGDGLGIVGALAAGMVDGTSLVRDEVLVPTPEAPFEFYEDETATRVVDRITLAVDVGGYRPASAQGGLSVRLVTPDQVQPTAVSPNVHHTDLWSAAVRPYETGWSADVLGSLPLALSAGDARVTTVVPFGLATDILGYSGGSLEGVAYAASATLVGDFLKAANWFLEQVWRPIAETLAWIVEQVRALLQTVMELVTQLSELVQDIIAQVAEVIGDAVQLAKSLLDSVFSGALQGIADFLCSLLPVDVLTRGEGLTFHLQTCQPRGVSVRAEIQVLGLALTVQVLRLDAVQPPPRARDGYDLVVRLTADSWALHLDAAFDARRAILDHYFEGRLAWDGAWAVDLAAPVADPAVWAGEGVTLPLPTFTVEAGYAFRLTEEAKSLDVAGVVAAALQETWDALGLPTSVEAFVGWLRMATGKVIHSVVEWLRGELDKVLEASLYLKFAFGAAAGFGLRFALVVGGEGLRAGFEWLLENLREFLDALPRLAVPAAFWDVPAEFVEDLRLRGDGFVEIDFPDWISGGVGGRFALDVRLEANVPAIGALFGQDWGRWEVTFGALIEGLPAAIVDPLFDTGGADADVWLLQARAHALG